MRFDFWRKAVVGMMMTGLLAGFMAQQAAAQKNNNNGNGGAGLTGSVHTTLADGTPQQTFESKDAVYLDDGPQNENANGLPAGIYYFQVTDPSGNTLLSTDPAVCRQLTVDSAGRISGALPVNHPTTGAPCEHPNGTLNATTGGTPVKLMPFADTPNPDGVYKAWLIAQSTTVSGCNSAPASAGSAVLVFDNKCAKTHNFTVSPPPLVHMPVNKLVNGIAAVCDDPSTPAIDESGSVPNGTGTGDNTGARPCTYTEEGETTPFLTLVGDDPSTTEVNEADPRFTVNAYLTGEDGLPFGIDPSTDPPTPVAFPNGPLISALIPPEFAPDVPAGFAATICEMTPTSPFVLTSVLLTSRDADGNVLNAEFADVYDPLPPSGYRCFNIVVPDVFEFAIDLNNSTVCTYTQGGWGQTASNGENVGRIRDAGFDTVYPGSLVIGGGFTMTFDSSADVDAYPHNGAGGPGKLAASYLNPTVNNESGIFGHQVMALQLNVDFGNLGLLKLNDLNSGIGGFTFNQTGSPWDGQTVGAILADANLVLGGGSSAFGGTVTQLNELVTLLNESFGSCVPGAGSVYLVPTTPADPE